LAYWDDYRERKEAVTNMYIKAKEQLALKRVWVLMATFHTFISKIAHKYKVQLTIEMIAAKKLKAVS
jgi:hypothetical protein